VLLCIVRTATKAVGCQAALQQAIRMPSRCHQTIFLNALMHYSVYVLSNSELVQCNFFIFDHVTFIHFKILSCLDE